MFVSRILIYPVKSLDPVELPAATLLASGALQHDRMFALFDESGKYVNGKRYAAVHRLRSHFDVEARALSLHDASEPGLGDATFCVDTERPALEAWLREYFGFPVWLRENTDLGFPDDTDSPGPTVISVATLEEIGRWFGLTLEEVRLRFRTNIEIGGVPPFWEDRLFGPKGSVIRFRLGDTTLEGINPCQRCAVPPRDPKTGENDATFVRRFTELRDRTLPQWSTRERFNHFYRVAINTRPHGDQDSKAVARGDAVEVLDVPEPSLPAVAAANGKPLYWAGELEVESVRDETPSVRTFRLRDPSGGPLPFEHLPGQFVTLTLQHDGKEVQRCYTIASSPSRPDICELTIKRDGAVSAALHERLLAGTRIAVSGPMGQFGFTGESEEGVVFIAGGVGITPLMSKIRYLLDRDWPGRIDLLYSVRTKADIIFAEELAALQKSAPRFHVHLTLTSPDVGDGWTGGRGRVSAAWISSVVPDIANRRVRLCGPTAMAAATQGLLHTLGVPEGSIAIEAFGGAPLAAIENASPQTVSFARSERSIIVEGNQTLLDAALRAGVALDHGCRAGVCGRCRAQLLQGDVAVDCDFVLSPEEKAARMILTCQAHPLSAVVLDV